MQAVSLFSNCGAGDVGYHEAGFNFAVMAELEPQRMEVCALNHPGTHPIPGDLRETWPTVVAKWQECYPNERPALLCACPPCQGMSSARAGIGPAGDLANGTNDARNLLVEVVADVIQALQPRVVVLENVHMFLTRLVPHPVTGEGISAPRLLQERIGDTYHFFPVLVDLADYGVPQTRKRAFITLVRTDEPWLEALLAAHRLPFPAPHATRTTFAQWFTLHPVAALDPVTAPTSDDPLHAVSPWPADDKRYAMIAATKHNGGSAWKNTLCKAQHENPNVDLKAVYCTHPGCVEPLLRPVFQEADGTYRLITGFKSSYRRMHEGQVASTVTTASGHVGSDINLHPTQNRVLSPRECALLQTFPIDFKWGNVLAKGALGKIREMIGEAVPPLFTEAHGSVLTALLEGTVNYDDLLQTTNVRATVARTKFEAQPIVATGAEAAHQPANGCTA